MGVQEQAGPIAQAAQQGSLNQVAYVDPSDPSTLYVVQPEAAPGTQADTKLEVVYEVDEAAEVKIIEGTYTGNWVKCKILGPGSTPGTYNINILQTTDFDSVGGFAGKDVPDISTEHLRKAGDASKVR